PYTRHVNNHVMLLGVMALLFLQLEALAQDGRMGPLRMLAVGGLAGLAYCLDLGMGPVLLLCLAPLLLYRCRRAAPLAWCALGLLPWLAAHTALNYWIRGTPQPMNAVPEDSQWPRRPLTPPACGGTAPGSSSPTPWGCCSASRALSATTCRHSWRCRPCGRTARRCGGGPRRCSGWPGRPAAG